MQEKQIVIYQTESGATEIKVTIENDTLWLSQKMMAELFEKDPDTIGLHIKNIYSDGELKEQATTELFSVVQKEGNRNVKRNITYYNLDVILSVGYRVSSRRGTEFRIWANKILKDHLVKGFTLNEKRLQEQAEQFIALKKTVKLLGNVLDTKPLSTDEATGLLHVITDYTYALDILDKYDHGNLVIEATRKTQLFVINYQDAINAIKGLKDKFGGSRFFANEKDESFKSSIAAIYQSFDGKDVYPSIEEKAAHLLYFVVKNHSFTDGNKRIAAFLFVWFLERNGILYLENGMKRIADNALVALTLMIAESPPNEKEVMTTVLVNLINGNN